METDMRDNICHFIPYRKEYDSIHTINFVLESKERMLDKLKAESVYKIYYVNSGYGFIHTSGRVSELFEGDIFFTFPAMPFCIESGTDFSYTYISFLGTRANMILDMYNICSDNFIFRDFKELKNHWQNCFEFGSELSDMSSESALLYAFACIGKRLAVEGSYERKKEETVSLVKKYIDDNFCDADMSLEKIGKSVNYNEKYISSLFKSYLKIGITDYVNTLRMQYACTLMQQGYRSIKDISNMCGYADQNYFSRVFKKRMGVSPREYILSLTNKHDLTL